MSRLIVGVEDLATSGRNQYSKVAQFSGHILPSVCLSVGMLEFGNLFNH